MTSEQIVFYCDDLKRHILSFLRKIPKISCAWCNCVCVWDKKVKDYIQVYPYFNSENKHYCMECLHIYYSELNNGCKIT